MGTGARRGAGGREASPPPARPARFTSTCSWGPSCRPRGVRPGGGGSQNLCCVNLAPPAPAASPLRAPRRPLFRGSGTTSGASGSPCRPVEGEQGRGRRRPLRGACALVSLATSAAPRRPPLGPAVGRGGVGGLEPDDHQGEQLQDGAPGLELANVDGDDGRGASPELGPSAPQPPAAEGPPDGRALDVDRGRQLGQLGHGGRRQRRQRSRRAVAPCRPWPPLPGCPRN